jgi:broad specificity phosphatase PhoE
MRHARTRLLGMALLVLTAAGSLPGGAAADDETALWEALRSGAAFAMIRHALAPGTGDPADFDINDCTTQRNLDDEGRAQAVELGKRFRAQGIDDVTVHTSAWCRCVDTADLMALGPVEILAPLNSFFRQMDRRAAQTDALRAWLADQPADTPIVLVTHQVNITALTDVFPRSGEIIVVARDGGAVQGRL